MKKILFLLIAAFVAIGSFAASKESKVSTFHDDMKETISTIHEDITLATSTLYGDSKDAIASVYPDVKSAVIAIGKAIGVAAEHVYTVLIKKFVVDGIVQLLPFLLGLLLIGIGWNKIANFFKTSQKMNWHFLYPMLLLLIGITILTNVDYNTMVMGLVNPEYGALNYILEYSKEMLK